MNVKGINTIEEILMKSIGDDAIISISHKLYGAQKIKLKPEYILDNQRIGFKLHNGQEIFIYKDAIVDCGIKDGIYFADELMKVSIKLNR